MNRVAWGVAVVLMGGVLGGGSAWSGWNPDALEVAPQEGIDNREVAETIARFKSRDPSLRRFIQKAYAYAVFPNVTKGGLAIGGAYGEGEVFEQGVLVGRATLAQVTIGFQFGGQAYSEMVFFKDQAALERFKSGNYELSAQVSAVAATTGASADADYSDGVAVFTMAKTGLMYEASVGGQRFGFTPLP